MKIITIKKPEVAIKLTKEQAENLGIDYTKDAIRGKLKTFGLWNLPKSYETLCIHKEYENNIPEETTIYGIRTMYNVKQSGYCLEGYVKVNSKQRSAFTTSQLFEVEGHLIDVACIFARK